MRASLFSFALVALPLAGGCFQTDHGDDVIGPGTCDVEPTFTIDTGASITHVAGEDAGYYAEYDGSGAWHFEWTCDTKLSSLGCEFSGTIIAPTPAGGVGATCFQCESDDSLTTSENGANTELEFDTDTSTGLDGVDFVTTPGATVEIDFQINGIDQDDLVFLPSDGNTTTPTCMPIVLKPSTP